ncbi:MAG: 50S ribosomal protein L4 [bacterium]
MKVNTYTKTGNKSESQIELVDSIWAVPMNKDLVAQVINVFLNNQRKHTATVKTRGDVRGGGKKPWKQKHTGRARHGSIRSPLWVGGGVTFGPTGYKKTLKIPKKMRDLSLKCLLSDKVKNEDVLVINEISTEKVVKTKDMQNLLKKLGIEGKKVLIAYEGDVKEKENIRKGFGNIKNSVVLDSRNICSHSIINSDKLVITKNAVKEIEERLK